MDLKCNELISIIIPVYNVEKFLDRCILSIVNQTYSNLEIILVDDGSTDSSGFICDKWEAIDKRIRVIHKTNGGLSDARNQGTLLASGEYLIYVDSDDFVSEEFAAYLYKLLKKNDATIAACNYYRTSGTNQPIITDGEEIFVYNSGVEACKAMMSKHGFMITAWAKLIPLELAKKYPFPVGRNQEDEATTYKYYYDAPVTVVSNKRLYGYFQNDNGIMKSNTNRNLSELVISLKERVDYFADKNRDLYMLSLARYVRQYFKGVQLDCVVGDNQIKELIKQDFRNSYESRKMKVLCFLFLLFGTKSIKCFPKKIK